ncbi:Zinc finger SWIM domain-containing protein [Schistosoma japonicum]|uniref:Zinc finger SWIM domain-containing protein n=1 Tax=Schistosoma japonicum TaxID=6182 RepID=A0A4Z2DD53_SCHJA|nr:Zinc finger SWIM domain-containing protein [Schistosoma japonicum]
MSSYSSPRTPNVESDMDFSIYSPSSEFDLDFTFRSSKKGVYNKEDLNRKHFNSPESLLVLTAKAIALHFPFEVVESSPVTVPEELQRLIAFHSFPTDEDDIWLYSCLSSGGSYEFDQGEALWADKAVKECVQIGFHLSATVLTSLHIAPAFVLPANNEDNGINNNNHNNPSSVDNFVPYVINPSSNYANRAQSNFENLGTINQNNVNNNNNNRLRKRGINVEPDYPAHRVSLTFDRQRITSCSCTCTFDLEERCTAVASPSNFGDKNVVNVDSPENIGNSIKPNYFAYQPMNTTEPNSGMLWQFSARGGSIFSNPLINSRQMSNQLNNCFTKSNCLSKNSCNQTSPNSRRSWLFNQHIANQNNMRHDLVSTNGQHPTGTWCSHVVATCLMRIRQPEKVLLRAPISESLSKLSREDLQKFAQNLICHVGPRKILPAAQRILDQLLASTNNPIKNSAGAPDPTVGGALGDAAAWCFDGGVLEEKLRGTLRRFWAPRPVLYSDFESLSFNSPTEVESFHCILRSYRANEPRGLWALLSFIRDMMKRQDNNGVLLLEIVTRCILDMNKVMYWWCTVQTNPCHFPESVSVRQKQTQCVAVWLCEEIVQLWSLACLNPELRPVLNHINYKSVSSSSSSSSSTSSCRNGMFSTANCKSNSSSDCCWLLQQIAHRLQAFHAFALKQADFQPNSTSTTDKNVMTMAWCDTLGNGLFPNEMSFQGDADSISKNVSLFSGFVPALAACRLSWSSEVPPTYGLSGAEFLKFMPLFCGAYVNSDSEITEHANIILNFSKNYFNTMRNNNHFLIELDNYWGTDQVNSQLFNNLPLPANHIEFAFTRFQAFNSHGYTEQALHWARYLALLLLYTSNEFINECEQASFEIVGRVKYQSSETITTTTTNNNNINNNNTATIHRNTDHSHTGPFKTNAYESYSSSYQSNSQKPMSTSSRMPTLWSTNSGVSSSVGNNSNTRRNSRTTRSKKAATHSSTSNSRETTEKYTNSIKLHPLSKKLSIDYTKKVFAH